MLDFSVIFEVMQYILNFSGFLIILGFLYLVIRVVNYLSGEEF